MTFYIIFSDQLTERDGLIKQMKDECEEYNMNVS